MQVLEVNSRYGNVYSSESFSTLELANPRDDVLWKKPPLVRHGAAGTMNSDIAQMVSAFAALRGAGQLL